MRQAQAKPKDDEKETDHDDADDDKDTVVVVVVVVVLVVVAAAAVIAPQRPTAGSVNVTVLATYTHNGSILGSCFSMLHVLFNL